MHRFLPDSIAFACGVDYAELRAALSSTTILPHTGLVDKECSKVRTSDLFYQHERDELLHFATVVKDTVDKYSQKTMSLITESEIDHIYASVIRPARSLGVSSSYVV